MPDEYAFILHVLRLKFSASANFYMRYCARNFPFRMQRKDHHQAPPCTPAMAAFPTLRVATSAPCVTYA
jgi:hypothetical protein